MKILKYVTGLLSQGIKVVYIPGNHDEMLRRFAGFKLGSFKIANKVLLKAGGKKTWIFHGDVFDITMQYSSWIAKLGAIGYDSLILLNAFMNFLLFKLGFGKISFSKRIKDRVKTAVKYINDFEETAARIAIDNNYDYVVCGHIHEPQIREINTRKGKEVTYLNSGDWVENLTALELHNGQWSLYRFRDDPVAIVEFDAKKEAKNKIEIKSINQQLISDFKKT